MITRHETYTDRTDIWAKLAAPLPSGVVSWRQDGRIIAREGSYFSRYVAYVDANTVRERLDGVVPGEWDLTLELLPTLPATDDEGALCSFKARLQILGVIREDVGTGRDYKSAATDAFKRAAVRFGVAHELYGYESNWVQMDGDGRNAKPLEDPQVAYVRRHGPPPGSEGAATTEPSADAGSPAAMLAAADAETPGCPSCGGRMWDNRLTKRNPRAPDFRCRDRSCDGVIWPPRTPAESVAAAGEESVPF